MFTTPPFTTPSTNTSPIAPDPRRSSCGLCRCWRMRVASFESERGQTTAEYALVLIAAATIAMLIVAWAGNTGAISDFFDTIIDRITSMLP